MLVHQRGSFNTVEHEIVSIQAACVDSGRVPRVPAVLTAFLLSKSGGFDHVVCLDDRVTWARSLHHASATSQGERKDEYVGFHSPEYTLVSHGFNLLFLNHV